MTLVTQHPSARPETVPRRRKQTVLAFTARRRISLVMTVSNTSITICVCDMAAAQLDRVSAASNVALLAAAPRAIERKQSICLTKRSSVRQSFIFGLANPLITWA